VDVHRRPIFDILRVPEGEFNRLKASFDYYYPLHKAYQYTRLLYCVSRLPEVVLIVVLYNSMYCLTCFEVNNKKCNFLESMVFVLL